jgi:hypothetical protein
MTDCMEPYPSSEAANLSGTQYFTNIVWNPMVHYRVHKSPQLVHTLSQIYPYNNISSGFSKIHFSTILPYASRFS